MNVLKKVLLIALVLLMTLSVYTFAQEAIVIDSVTFFEYTDNLGSNDDSLVNCKISFTAVSAEQVSILLAAENISEVSNETKSKVIFMDQIDVPEDGVYEFTIEKSRIASATGLEDIEGCTLYVKLGGRKVDEMVSKSVTYHDPTTLNVMIGDVDGDEEITNRDATMLLRYLANWEQEGVIVEAMDIDGDKEISNRDGTQLLRYLAGWDIDLD